LAWHDGRMSADDARKRHLVRRFLTLVAVFGAVPALGAIVSRKLARGDHDSSDLRVAAIGGGREVHARSEMLLSVEAIAVMGGIELDLTGSTPVPGGATVDVLAVMGGVEVKVPGTWAVEVEQEVVAGGVEVRVPDIEDLPPDAPLVTVRVRAYLGGVEVRASAF